MTIVSHSRPKVWRSKRWLRIRATRSAEGEYACVHAHHGIQRHFATTISVFPMSVLIMVIIAPRTHGEHARSADISL